MLILIFLAGVYISRAAFVTFADWSGSLHPDGHDPGIPMTGAMLLGALAALGLGWALSGQLENVLGFPDVTELTWFWRVVAVLASLSGLIWGGWHAVRSGPAPAFGLFPRLLERGLNFTTNFLGRLVLKIATGLDYIEDGLDRLVQIISKSTLALAQATDVTERRGFSFGIDHFASLLSLAGEHLRQLQTGKLYFYTLAVFVWLLAVGIVGALLWGG